MRSRLQTFCLLLICVVVIISASGCGIKSIIKGQVVDAESGKPIEGAAIAVKWYKYRIGPPLASGYKKIETAETLSDADGFFRIPKYTGRNHYMGVYKRGYVCWDSLHIFHPSGKSYEERIEKRKGHEVKNGMIIKLEPFRSEYPKDYHATFANNVSGRLSASGFGLFDKAIEQETLLHRKRLREKN